MILQDYILEIENVIPDNICDEICDNGITDSKSFERALIHDGILAENRKCLVKDINEKYSSALYKAVDTVLNKYKDAHPSFHTGMTVQDSGYDHLIYNSQEKAEYKIHIDSADHQFRVLSISITLNDEYEGGDFVFFDDSSYKIKTKNGTAIAFPSNFCFPHAVTPITKGIRQAVITWIL